jgi:hypothetical protein
MKQLHLILTLLICTVSLFAGKATFTWEWVPGDDAIRTSRYQIDGGPMTVLDGGVRSITSSPLDAKTEHVISLAQSYDGIHYGPEATATSSQAVRRRWMDPNRPITNQFHLDAALYGGIDYLLTDSTKPVTDQVTNIQCGIDIGFHNIFRFAKTQGLSFNLGVGYEPYPVGNYWAATDWKHAVSGTGILSYEFSMRKLSFQAGFGAFLYYWLGNGLAWDSSLLFYGLAGNLRSTYDFSDHFFVGTSLYCRYYLYSFFLKEANFGAAKGAGAMTMGADILMGVRL